MLCCTFKNLLSMFFFILDSILYPMMFNNQLHSNQIYFILFFTVPCRTITVEKKMVEEIFTPGNKIYLVLVLHGNCVEFKGALYKTDYSLNFFLYPDLVEFITACYE